MHKPSNCTDDFYNKLVIASGTDQNARATQAQKAETVVNYSNNNNPNNTRNYGSKLRCYNETQFRNACSKLTNYKDIVNAKHRQLMLMVFYVSDPYLTCIIHFMACPTRFFHRNLGCHWLT